MKPTAVLALASSLFILVSAQEYPDIKPDDISNSTREIWCGQQTESCKNLCQDQTHADPQYNDCWSEDLHYECICKNGIKPSVKEYSLPIPYNLCMMSKQACADNCGNNQDCATLCFSKKQCGAADPRRVNVTSTTTTGSATGTSTNTAYGTSSATTTSNSDPFSNSMGVSLIALGSSYGIGAMIAGMAIGFFGML